MMSDDQKPACDHPEAFHSDAGCSLCSLALVHRAEDVALAGEGFALAMDPNATDEQLAAEQKFLDAHPEIRDKSVADHVRDAEQLEKDVKAGYYPDIHLKNPKRKSSDACRATLPRRRKACR